MSSPGWPFPTSFYFAAQTLLGVGFGVPYETNDYSHVFSTFYIIIGTTVIIGSVAEMAAFLLSPSDGALGIDFMTSAGNLILSVVKIYIFAIMAHCTLKSVANELPGSQN